jgi:FtsP/CotA-like multicopper oxidase with cupredoxin domain
MPPAERGGHLNDVKYDAFLANDRTLADPQVVTVEQGGRVLLRVVNGSAMSNYHIDLGDLDAELIAVDGCPVVPVRSRIFPITTAQRLDIRLTVPQSAAAYPILAKHERAHRGLHLPVARLAIFRKFTETFSCLGHSITWVQVR